LTIYFGFCLFFVCVRHKRLFWHCALLTDFDFFSRYAVFKVLTERLRPAV